MFKFPQIVVYAIIALNLSVFTGFLQADLLIIQSPTAKVISWILTIAAWTLTYVNRHKFYTIQLTSTSKMHHE